MICLLAADLVTKYLHYPCKKDLFLDLDKVIITFYSNTHFWRHNFFYFAFSYSFRLLIINSLLRKMLAYMIYRKRFPVDYGIHINLMMQVFLTNSIFHLNYFILQIYLERDTKISLKC